MTAIPFTKPIHYPESDGKPMAETDVHRREVSDLIGALDDRFRDTPDVYVAGNLFLYYVEGDPRKVVAPDVFVVKGVPKGNRRIYKLWEEGHVPCMVIELTSDSTRQEDLETKKDCYARLGVEEYFLHDPLGDYLEPPLQGFRLEGGRYHRIAPAPDGSLEIRTLGLRLRKEGERSRLTDAATGDPLPRLDEAYQQARELARLRRELERSRD